MQKACELNSLKAENYSSLSNANVVKMSSIWKGKSAHLLMTDNIEHILIQSIWSLLVRKLI